MADQNQVNVKLDLSSNGSVEKTTESVKSLRKEIDGAVNASKALQSAASASGGGSATLRRAKETAVTPEESMDYGRVRSFAGTGAAGRDFAKQAQGLGGIVHLYATFAANIFAVGAAFEALNKAAQFERLAKASELMGNTLGANLTGIASKVQELTGHAISMQESMQFTNMATSAGLAGRQIEALTKIAKGAASALGRDTGDSIRRIITGTAKQEQEILDELGIFVKAKDAYEVYAKKFEIKGGGDALTAQQKVIAYADAVEKAGQKWNQFAALDDPFSRFVATGKESLTELLSAINAVFVPLLSFLAESGEAIKGIIILITGYLAKRALPEAKSLLLNFFTFDKRRAEALAAEAKKVIIDDYINTTKQLALLKKEREAILLPDPKAAVATTIGEDLYRRGKQGTEGLSLQRVSTAVFGSAEDVARLKQAKDVEDAITKSVYAQIKGRKEQQVLVDALIAKNIITKNSTVEKIALDTRGKEIAQGIFATVQQTNSALERQATLEKLILSTTKEEAAIKKRMAASNIAIEGQTGAKAVSQPALNVGAASAADDIVLAAGASALLNNTNQTLVKTNVALLDSNLKTAKGMEAFRAGALLNSNALEALRTNADITVKGSLANLIASMKIAGTSMVTAGVQTSGLSKVLAVAGAGFSGLRLGVAALATTIGALFGPLTIAYTLWQLFGDTIKEFLGITSDETRRHEERVQALGELGKSAVAAAEAMKTLNAANVAEGISSQELIVIDNKRISVLQNLISATQDYLNKRSELKAQEAQDKVKDVKGDNYSAEAEALRAAVQSNQATAQERAAAESLASTLEKLAGMRSKANKEASWGAIVGPEHTRILNAQIAANEAYDKALEQQIPLLNDINKRQNQTSVQTNALATATKNATDAFEDLDKTKLNDKLKDLGLTGRNTQKVFESFNNIVGQTLSTDEQKLAQVNDTILVLETLKKNAGDDTGNISYLISGLKAAAGDAQAMAQYMALTAEFAQATPNGALLEILKGIESRDSHRKAKIQPFSIEDLALLEKMRAGIKEIEIELAKLGGANQVSDTIAGLMNNLRGFTSAAEAGAKATREISVAQAAYDKSVREAELKYQEVVLRKDTGGRDRAQLVAEAKTTLENTKQIAAINRDNAVLQANITSSITAGNAELQERVQLLEEERQSVEAQAAIEANINSLMSARNSSLNELGLISEAELARRQYLVSIAQTENEERLKLLDITNKYSEKLDRITEAETQAKNAGKLTADVAKGIAAERAKAVKAYERELVLTKTVSATEKAKLAIEKDSKLQIAAQNKELEKQAKLMSKLESFAESLAEVFGDFGKGLGSFIVQQQKSADQLKAIDKDYAKEKSKVLEESDISALERIDKLAEVDKEYNDARLRSALDSYAAEAKAAKGLFGEKTLAYKVLSGIEQGMHIAKMIMMAKEVAMDTVATATMVANAVTGATADGAHAVIKQGTGGDVYSAFARMAAMAAIVASVLASIGGSSKGVSIPGGASAQDRQETQGTGLTWGMKDGKMQKIETGGGVFGDVEAKSNSINNSLEIIRDNTIEGLVYDNRMLKALESIDKGINAAAKSLYSTSGIRTGSMFGTKEGSSSSGISWLFGSSTSKSIIDAGVAIKGTFQQLMEGLGQLTAYETTSTTKKSGGFLGIGGSTKTSITTQTTGLSEDLNRQITDIFAKAGDAFVIAGDKLGMTAEEVMSKLGSVRIDQIASLRGLQGEDLEKEFNAVISNILDSASSILFKDLEKFRQFGEGMLETVTRVVDSNEKVKAALTSMGKGIAEIPFDLSEALVEAAGGLENFVDQSKFFVSNFLTEAERLAPIQESVSKRMEELGYASVDTREEFKALVMSLDLTNESQRELYQDLMDVSEAFAQAHEAITKSLSAEEYRTKTLDLEITKLELLGRASEAVALQREEEIRQLEKLPAEQAANLIATTKLIWALQDALDVRNSEIDILKAQGFAYHALQAERELELNSLTDEQKVLKAQQYAAEDAAATRELEISLMEAQGLTTQALNARRALELKGLSENDQALKQRIYALEDETRILDARAEQDTRVYELLGKSEEALSVTRQRELVGMEEYLRAGQEYIYALEDEAALKDKLIEARDRERDALEGTISSINDSIKALEDYKQSLMTGSLSTLTPQQQYEQNKAEALRLADIASRTAVTEAEKAAQQDAINKLPAATDAWLQSSKTLFASSEQYSTDFASVMSLLDSTTSALGDQKTEAEQQLSAMLESVSFLTSIDESTRTVADLLPQYLELQARTEAARILAAESGLVSAGSMYSGIDQMPILVDELTTPLTNLNDLLSSIVETQQADMAAQAYIAPPNSNLEAQNTELIAEIQQLRTEITQLRTEQAEQSNQQIQSNYDANLQGAQLVADSNRQLYEDNTWSDRTNTQIV